MVLATEEFLVVVQLDWQRDFVTGRAELRGFMERLQERLFVERRLGFHHLVVDPLQDRVLAERKRVVLRLLDGVGRVAGGAVDVGDGMAGGASDAGMGGGVLDVVEIRIVEGAAEERYHVVAAGAPARGLHVAVALLAHFARLPDAEQVRRIVERAELMGRVQVIVGDVGMALHAVAVHHQRFGRDEVARRGSRRRGMEILHAFFRAGLIPLPGVLRMQHEHGGTESTDAQAPPAAPTPLDARPGLAVQHVDAYRGQRQEQVQPEHDAVRLRIGAQLRHAFEPHQCVTARAHEQPGEEQDDAELDGIAIGARAGRQPMENAEDHERRRHEHADADVADQHPVLKRLGVGLAGEVLQQPDAGEISAGGPEHGKGGENQHQQDFQPWADGGNVGTNGDAHAGARARSWSLSAHDGSSPVPGSKITGGRAGQPAAVRCAANAHAETTAAPASQKRSADAGRLRH